MDCGHGRAAGRGARRQGAPQRLDEAMKLAQSLGAETQTLTATDIPAELLRFAKFENVTQIVIGRSRGGFLSELLAPVAAA